MITAEQFIVAFGDQAGHKALEIAWAHLDLGELPEFRALCPAVRELARRGYFEIEEMETAEAPRHGEGTMTTAEIGAKLRKTADAHPFEPLNLRPPDARHCCWVTFEGFRCKVQLTRMNMRTMQLYHLSIGITNAEPRPMPDEVADRLAQQVLPGASLLCEAPHSRQFSREIAPAECN